MQILSTKPLSLLIICSIGQLALETIFPISVYLFNFFYADAHLFHFIHNFYSFFWIFDHLEYHTSTVLHDTFKDHTFIIW